MYTTISMIAYFTIDCQFKGLSDKHNIIEMYASGDVLNLNCIQLFVRQYYCLPPKAKDLHHNHKELLELLFSDFSFGLCLINSQHFATPNFLLLLF